MFGFLEEIIGNKIKHYMHNKRTPMIQHTLIVYNSQHHADEATLARLQGKLEAEAIRIYPMVDDSILAARIKQARYTFWVTAIAGSAISIAFYFTLITSTIVTIFVPLMGAVAAWLVSIGTIPVLYEERIKGAMDSVVVVFESERNVNDIADEVRVDMTHVMALQETIHAMNQRITTLSDLLNALVVPSSDHQPSEVLPLLNTSVTGISLWQPAGKVIEEIELQEQHYNQTVQPK